MNAAMIFICNEKGLSCYQEREKARHIERTSEERRRRRVENNNNENFSPANGSIC